MALPNPFQNTIVTPVVNSSIVKTTQNDTNYFHGYRSTFNIDQQKEQYQQQKNQQQEQQQHHHHQQHHQPNSQNASKHQPTQFNRNIHHNHNRNHQPNRNASAKRNSNHTVNAGFVSNWCDLCERGFKFPHQLEKHRSEHEKCWFENCTFEGHTQLLKKHIEVQHQSGLFQRILKVETDEDIEKWREERRKRYPTASNIEARRQAQEERLKRGERIAEPTNRFGNINNRKRAQQHRSLATTEPNESTKSIVTNDATKKRNDNKRRRRPRQRNKNSRLGKKEHIECGKKNESETTQNETAAETAVVVVNTETANCAVQPVVTEKMAQNSSALAAIMGMYGSDSDSNSDDDNDEVMTAVTTVTAIDTTTTIENKKDENVCMEMDMNPLDSVDKLTPKEVEVIEDAVNLKRPSEFDDDEVPNKQTKIDSDVVIENFKQNMTIESDDEAPDEQPIQRQSEVIQDTDDIKLESGPTKTKPIITATTSQNLTNERIPKRKTVLDTTRKIRSQNTLLEKLLQKDIRHERNVLLQCVRYVVEQNFFGIGQTIDEQK